MRKFTSFIVLNVLIASMIFISVAAISASAGLSYYCEGASADWTIKVSGWTYVPGIDGNVCKQTAASARLSANYTGISTGYWSFDFKVPAGGSDGQLRFASDTGSNYIGLSFAPNNGITPISSGTGAGFTFTATSVFTTGAWYHVAMTKTGNNLAIVVTNKTLGTSYGNTLATWVETGFNGIEIAGGNGLVEFDNIYVDISGAAAAGQNTITWNSQDYVKSDIGSYTWAISGTDWADKYLGIIPYSFYADIYKYGDSGAQFIKEDSLSTQSGTLTYQFSEIGTYQIKLIKYLSYIGITSTVIANNTILVKSAGTPEIYVNSTVPVGSKLPFNIKFIWGTTPANFQYSGISAFKLGTDGLYYQTNFKLLPQFGLSSVSASTLYIVNMSVFNEGVYEIRLEDFDKGVIAKTTTKAKIIKYPGTTNITTSWLNIYNYGNPFVFNQGMRVLYGIDGTNYTSQSLGYQFFLRTFNYDRNSYVGEKALYEQMGDNVYILTPISIPESKRFGNELDVMEGNNSLRLVARNTSTEIIIDYQNFTINSKDTEGYGITLFKTQFCKGESIGITVYSPDASLLTLYKTRTGYTNLRDIVKTYRINVTTGMNIMTNLKTSGEYTFVLTKYDNTTIDRDFSVNECATATPTVTETTTGIQQATALANLLDSNIFWALIMTVGLMIATAVAVRGKKE